MAIETIDVDPTSTGTPKPVAADRIGTDYYQVVKLAVGADGSMRLIEDADGMPVKVASLPLPTGASSEATLALMKTATDSILTASAAIQAAVDALNTKTTIVNTGNIGGTVNANISGAVSQSGAWSVAVNNFPATQPVSFTWAGLTDAQLRASPVPVSLASTTITGTVGVTGTFWQATQPVSAAALPLPAGASTEATLTALNGKFSALGQQTMAASTSVVIASNQSSIPTVENALILTGASAQTAVVNNILENPSGATGTTVDNYRAMSVQVVSTATAGTFIFEQSNTGAAGDWVALPVFNAALSTAVPITAAITATASSIIYTFPLRCRFVRLRIVTLLTGGSVQAFSRVSSEPWTPTAALVASNTAANLLAQVSGTITTNNAAGTNAIGDVGIQLRANATGASSTLKIVSAATTNATIVKASAGRVVGYQLQNTTASVVYVKLHNQATTPTAGASVFLPIAIPANGKAEFASEAGIAFTTGIGLTTVTGAADADATAVALNAIVGSIQFA
ncbi:MAG: hypothetical protein ING73_14490 [Rhodocyclaceae bacterium]|nr:hypothetical protein [Rhodocyclaceae bacterium]